MNWDVSFHRRNLLQKKKKISKKESSLISLKNVFNCRVCVLELFPVVGQRNVFISFSFKSQTLLLLLFLCFQACFSVAGFSVAGAAVAFSLPFFGFFGFLSFGAASPSTNLSSDVTISLTSPSGILCSLSYKVSSKGNPVTIISPLGSSKTVCLNWATNSAGKERIV